MRHQVLLFSALLATALACRKEPAPAPKPGAPPPPAPEIARAARETHPVIFVGLDGADWELLDDYMAAGVMPNLAALAREGRTATLKTVQPPLSPLVWTTMMTGASPLEHGILDFTRRNPGTGSARADPEQRAKGAGDLEHGQRGGQERRRLRRLGHLAGRAGEGAPGGGPLLRHPSRSRAAPRAPSTRRSRRPGRARRSARPRPRWVTTPSTPISPG